MLDPLGVVTRTRKDAGDVEEGPAEAPSTIVGREELVRQSKENYFYMPGMGDVPEIAVPDFLPDLVGKDTAGVEIQFSWNICVVL